MCFLGKNIGTFSCLFGVLGGFLHIFLMYSCSTSFRELKSAIKNQFFLFSIGGQIKFLIEKKNTWKNIGTTGEKYWVGLLFIHGWGGRRPPPPIHENNGASVK